MSDGGFAHVRLGEGRPRPGRYPGSCGEWLVDHQTPTRELVAFVVSLDPGTVVPLHYHAAESLEYVLTGRGVVRGHHQTCEVGPGSALYFPPGPAAAHEWRNTGPLHMQVLAVYVVPPGQDDGLQWVHPPGPAAGPHTGGAAPAAPSSAAPG